MKPYEFWDYSLSEIKDLLDSYERNCVKELKRTTVANCHLGMIVSRNINNIFGKVDDFVKPWDIYPELFEEEKQLFDLERNRIEAERRRESRKAYAKEHNRRRHIREEV